MAEERVYQGQTYRRNNPNEPWVRVGGQGGFIAGPNAGAREARAQQDQQFEAQRLEFERQRVALAEQQAALDAQRTQLGITEATDERTQTAEKADARRVQKTLSSDNLLSTLRNARQMVLDKGGAGVGAFMSTLPATEARTLKGYLDTIRANLTFDELQKMRENSPTGGAVGNASDNDMRLLGSTVAALDQYADPKKLLEDLARIEGHYAAFRVSLDGIDPLSEEGANLLKDYTAPAETAGSPLSGEQQRLIEAFYAANPNFTADQLRQFAQSIGVPNIANAEAIVEARDQGRGLSPAARAVFSPSDGQGNLSQGMSGVNEGIASVLGLPVDALTGAINLTTGGMNWLNEAVGGSPRANTPRIENPVGGSDWIRGQFGNAGFVGPEAQTDDGRFWRRTGQSVGAASVPGLGAGGSARAAIASMLSGVGGGLGAATAQQMFPDNPTAEIIGELLGAGTTGTAAVGYGTRAARNAVRDSVPTTDQLKQNAGDLYKQAESRGIVAQSPVTDALVGDIEDIARREALVSARGNVSEAYPKIGPVLKTIRDEAGQELNPTRIQVLRETLADAAYTTEGKEQRIAQEMLRAFDGATVPLAPELADARSVSRRYLQARPIEQAIELAGTRQGQYYQSGLDNALRGDFANLERSAIRGNENFRPEVLEAISKVANPTGARAAARWIGRLAPTSFISGAPGAGAMGLGYATGEPVLGTAIGATMYGAGMGGRAIANNLARQEAQDAALMARSGGTMRLPGAAETDSFDSVASALAAQSAPYYEEESARAQIERELLLNALYSQQ